MLVVLLSKLSDVEGNTFGKTTFARGAIKLEGAVEDGAVCSEITVVLDEFKSGEQWESGKRVGRYVLAEAEGYCKSRSVR